MSNVLEHQAVYCRPDKIVISVKMQICAAILLLAALVTKVWIKIENTDLGYQLAKERQRQVTLDMERRDLELQRSVLLRSDQLQKAAHERLGLRPLNPKQARKIKIDSSLQEV